MNQVQRLGACRSSREKGSVPMFSAVWIAVAVTLVALTVTGWRALTELDLIAGLREATPADPVTGQPVVLLPLKTAPPQSAA